MTTHSGARARAKAATALVVGVLAAATFAAPPAQAAARPEATSKVGLTCGIARIVRGEDTDYVTHSCTGNGKILYTVTCGKLANNVQFTHVYRGVGASIRQPVRCGLWGQPSSVSWKIV